MNPNEKIRKGSNKYKKPTRTGERKFGITSLSGDVFFNNSPNDQVCPGYKFPILLSISAGKRYSGGLVNNQYAIYHFLF
jgi:hypothetical protein